MNINQMMQKDIAYLTVRIFLVSCGSAPTLAGGYGIGLSALHVDNKATLRLARLTVSFLSKMSFHTVN